MAWYKEYKLVEDGENYIVEIYLNKESEEFADEFFSNIKENVLKLDDKIKNLLDDKFSGIKIKTVKVIMGTMLVATIPFAALPKAEAAEAAPLSATVQSTVTGVVTASRLNMRTGPSTTYSIMHVLWYGNKVKVIGESGSWYQIQLSDGRTGWVSKAYLWVNSVQQKIDTVVATAKSLLGTPYVWGGESPTEGGFDCSGFTQYVFSKAGYTLNRVSTEQAKQGIAVSWANLQPGDLVFSSINNTGAVDHVGIYIGNGQMIHSPKTGDVVKTTDITTAFWQTRFITARRIIY